MRRELKNTEKTNSFKEFAIKRQRNGTEAGEKWWVKVWLVSKWKTLHVFILICLPVGGDAGEKKYTCK